MTVTKETPSTAHVYAEYISFTPTPREIACFEADTRILSRSLLSDAIKEARASSTGHVPPAQQRVTVHNIYTRKVKELASLYPIIFALENGLRGTLSTLLASHFKRSDWWCVLRNAVTDGKTHTDFERICGVAVKRDFIKQVFFTISKILDGPSKNKLMDPQNEDQIYSLLTFGEMSRLMITDWELCRGIFRMDKSCIAQLDKGGFRKRANLVRDARNEIFHSNPIKNRMNVFEAAEVLLDAIDFHLGDFDCDLRDTTYTRAQAKSGRAERHMVPARLLPRIVPHDDANGVG